MVRLRARRHKPEGDLILCDVAREDASLIIADLKDLEVPQRGLDRGGVDRQLDLRRGDARPSTRRRGLPVGRGRLGGGRVAHLRADASCRSASSPSWSLAMQIAAVGIVLDSADPDRRRDGRRARSSARSPALCVALVRAPAAASRGAR